MKISYQSPIEFIQRYKKTILLIIAVVLITILLQTLISMWLSRSNTIRLPSFGTIYTLHVEAYGGDLQEENGRKSIDWGTVYPGIVVNRTFTVRSESNVDAKLIIRAINWIFNNSQGEIVKGPTNETNYIALTASLNETLITFNQSLEVTLTLVVPNSSDFIDFLVENDVTTFSFDIYIYLRQLTESE